MPVGGLVFVVAGLTFMVPPAVRHRVAGTSGSLLSPRDPSPEVRRRRRRSPSLDDRRLRLCGPRDVGRGLHRRADERVRRALLASLSG